MLLGATTTVSRRMLVAFVCAAVSHAPLLAQNGEQTLPADSPQKIGELPGDWARRGDTNVTALPGGRFAFGGATFAGGSGIRRGGANAFTPPGFGRITNTPSGSNGIGFSFSSFGFSTLSIAGGGGGSSNPNGG